MGLTYRSLVFEEDLSSEHGDLGVVGLADHLTLTGVHKGAHFEDLSGRTEVTLSETTTAA